MRVSFDLDDTLICYGPGTEAETCLWPKFLRRWFDEPLRQGARHLFSELRRRGCSIWIYTTSARKVWSVRVWLRLYGLYVDGIVNDAVHRRRVRSGDLSRLPSKWPPAFGIDLHIDDSEGVALEGRQLGFKVLVIRPDDANWVQSVLSTADDCEASAA